MRSFEERIAEIDRRSKKIQAERKKRRAQALVVCVPLVLCLGVGTFLLRQDRAPTQLADRDTVAAFYPCATLAEDIAAPVLGGSVEVVGQDLARYYTAPEKVDRIAAYLDAVSGDTVYYSSAFSKNEDATDADLRKEEDSSDTLLDESVAEVYTITLVCADGSRTEFELSGNRLTNKTENREITLQAQQLHTLKVLLEIG